MTDQPVRAEEKEAELIRQTFKDNEPLLKAMRAVLFGLNATGDEKEAVRAAFKNTELLNIVRRRFYPTLDKTSPIGTVQDVWLGAEQMIFAQAPTTITQAIGYKEQALHFTKVGLSLLENPDGPAPDLDFAAVKHPKDELAIGLLARNQYIRHIESQLLFLKQIADTVAPTPKQQEVRKKKDSSK